MQSALLTVSHPPVQPQLAHDAQNIHFPSGLQLLAANVGGNEAASPTNPCTREEMVRVTWESGAPGREGVQGEWRIPEKVGHQAMRVWFMGPVNGGH